MLTTQAIEAIILTADGSVSAGELARVVSDVSGEDVNGEDVERAVNALNEAYAEHGRAFRIERWAGGYRMATVPQVVSFLRALREQQQARRLSRSLMETLAVVAYRQPVTKPEIDYVRGVNADYALRKLLELDFIAVVGRSEAVGKPLLYGTGATFLDRFGLNSLDDLPRPREIEELLSDPAFTQERETLRDLDWSDSTHAEPQERPEPKAPSHLETQSGGDAD